MTLNGWNTMTRYGLDAIIPEGKAGHFEVKYQPAEDGSDYTETCLMYRGQMIMSDRSVEVETHKELFDVDLSGVVLVCGLGLGFVHRYLMDNDKIDKVVVVELFPEVEELVWPHCNKDDRFELVIADAQDWEPTDHFDYGWFDSWIPHNSMTHGEWVTHMSNRYADDCEHMMFWYDKEER
jgi:hypothetical protein